MDFIQFMFEKAISKEEKRYFDLHKDTTIEIKTLYKKGFINILKNYHSNNINIYEPDNIYILGLYGHLNIIKWLDSLCYDITYDGFSCFRGACINGNLHIIEWFQTFPNIDRWNKFGLPIAAASNHFNLIKYFLSKIDMVNSTKFIESAINNACYHGSSEVIQLLLHIKSDHIQIPFVNACQGGHLKMAQYLINKYDIDQKHQNLAFRGACKTGNIKIAQWLWSIGNIDLSHNLKVYSIIEKKRIHMQFGKKYTLRSIQKSNCDVFELTCFHGKLEIAKWLHMIGAPINYNKYRSLQTTLLRQHYHIAKWLISISDYDSYDKLFNMLCDKNNFESCKFLISNVDIKQSDNYNLVLNMIKEDLANFEIFKFMMFPKIKHLPMFDKNVFDIIIKSFLIY